MRDSEDARGAHRTAPTLSQAGAGRPSRPALARGFDNLCTILGTLISSHSI